MSKKKIVFLTGSGISAESGIKTFRDSDGLWENYKIEEVASINAWYENPKLVLDFYNMRRKDAANTMPNNAHKTITNLEKYFDVHIITQNVDDLHERAGSSKVLHLHGQLNKMRSVKNSENLFDYNKDLKIGDLAPDGGQLRPHIVWFGESVPEMENAANIVQEAEILVVIGTSLSVYPAAGLIQFAHSECPIYIIDPKIPYLESTKQITPIEAKAVEGSKILLNHLQKFIDEEINF